MMNHRWIGSYYDVGSNSFLLPMPSTCAPRSRAPALPKLARQPKNPPGAPSAKAKGSPKAKVSPKAAGKAKATAAKRMAKKVKM